MTIVLLCIGLAIILATIIFLFIVHFNRFEKFSDMFQYWLDPKYRLVYDAFVYYKKCPVQHIISSARTILRP